MCHNQPSPVLLSEKSEKSFPETKTKFTLRERKPGLASEKTTPHLCRNSLDHGFHANLAEGNATQWVATTVTYHTFNQNDVSILVESSSDFEVSDTRSLSDFGTVTTVAGRVAVLHTQMADLAGITHLPFVSGIEQSWPLHVYLDQSVPDIGANIVWKEVRDAQNRSVTGLGVIIGFVDTGIDVSHPDFRFPNGTTKILYVLGSNDNRTAPLWIRIWV